ncbi:MAG: tail fiber domain-containing protein [Verrucomicrobiales bacterium]|nr:tail fiber domain-containing protein [Verrucomicrobiales bacterium]MDA7644436.1 tail fiber domain-containing protein [Verrucomicrobiales bacterium]MDB4772974.1 tail fiber domain-containing protein [Verrucomicrobiales bacterium]MDF1789570.1 tail fiber domain-containing protein [Verrucomicrobiales bacterium]
MGDSIWRWKHLYAIDGTINTSDERLKTNIQDLNYGLEEVLKMRPTRYNWKSAPNDTDKVGLIAQELQTIIPEVVEASDDEDKTLGVAYSELITLLVRAIQEQQEQIAALKKAAKQ